MSLWVTWPRTHCRQPLVAADTKAMLHVNRLLESAIHACGAISRAKVWEICGWWLSRWISYIKPQQDAIPWKPDHRSTILDIWYMCWRLLKYSMDWFKGKSPETQWGMRLGTLVAFHTKRFWIDGCSSNQNMLWHCRFWFVTVLYYILFYYIMLFYIKLYYVMLFFIFILYYMMFVLCYIILFFIIL